MTRISTLTLIGATALGLAACGDSRLERTTSGAAIGAAGGAAIGALGGAPGVGAAAGAAAGGAVGALTDRADIDLGDFPF
ncbi:MAG: YMGG-like glycine zipper-containing protein [Pseudomonadota bacterium]